MADTPAPIDLDAYFARIGYGGPRAATLDTLKALHGLHPAAIPFETLDPLLGLPPQIGLGDLQAKLVAGGRGGYCYEQNGLFRAVLEALGFKVTGLAARVLWGEVADSPPRPRTHMALKVDLPDGPWLADVGFGGLVMTAPLRLTPDEPQATPNERFRLLSPREGHWELQAELDGGWKRLHGFDLAPHAPVDYEPLNWFSATHPQSPFVAVLMAARGEPDRRLALLNARFIIRRPGQAPEERTLASLDELAQVLTEAFGIALPEGFERIGPKLGLS